jgi:protein-L-isoaspartate(D-aspartate) O-methyltransferase
MQEIDKQQQRTKVITSDDLTPTRQEAMVDTLVARGLVSGRTIQAMKSVPRDVFVPELFLDRSWEDSAIPIPCGQTLSQPSVVATMTEALGIEARHRVLEIGTGSGYQTAVLARLCRYVYTIERYRSLMLEAEIKHRRLGLENIIYRYSDGWEGWVEQALFDRIIVTAALSESPSNLLAQLKPGGRLVAPLGKGAVQSLVAYEKSTDGDYRMDNLGEVRFVPLILGVAGES